MSMRRHTLEATRRPAGRRLPALLAVVVVLLAFAMLPGRTSAEQPPPKAPDGFVPADNLPAQEQLPAAPLVIGAYAVAWVAVFFYLWSIWQRLARVERELADVTRRVEAGGRR